MTIVTKTSFSVHSDEERVPNDVKIIAKQLKINFKKDEKKSKI